MPGEPVPDASDPDEGDSGNDDGDRIDPDPGSQPPEADPRDLPDTRRRVLSKAEILDAVGAMSVTEFTDLMRRFTIIYALNGLAPEFRAMTARERLSIVDQIIESEDAGQAGH